MHLQVNGGETANLRLFSDPLQPHEQRALDGLVMEPGDSLRYSFTYGIQPAADASSSSSKEHPVRACNTAVYSAKIEANP